MFSEIEKKYRKDLQERRFSAFYWPRAIIVVALALLADFTLGLNRWIVYGVMVALLLLFVAFFFIRDWRRSLLRVDPEKLQQTSRRRRAKVVLKSDDEIRINNLLADLKKHNIHTEADLEIAINYFERSRPVISKPSIPEWTLSIAVTLSSIVLLAYDTDTGVINTQRFITTFGSTTTIAIAILTPAIISKLISSRISATRTKADASLTEDLAFIYVNFEQYRSQLEP